MKKNLVLEVFFKNTLTIQKQGIAIFYVYDLEHNLVIEKKYKIKEFKGVEYANLLLSFLEEMDYDLISMIAAGEGYVYLIQEVK
jgi:hypothetical protein